MFPYARDPLMTRLPWSLANSPVRLNDIEWATEEQDMNPVDSAKAAR